MASNYSLAAIDEMNPDQIADLGPDVLADLCEQLVAGAAQLQVRSDKIQAGLDARYGGALVVERDKAKKDFGSVQVEDGEWQVKQTLKKAVVWDQAGLTKLAASIAAAGDDPKVFITEETKTTLKVSETSYESWPDDIKAAFQPYRTVKVQGTPSWKIEIKL
jgi:hypothetical protein